MGQINNKVIRALTKLIEAGFGDEKAILAMTMDDILALPRITVAEIETINSIQKAIKANKFITLLCSGEKPKREVGQKDGAGMSGREERASEECENDVIRENGMTGDGGENLSGENNQMGGYTSGEI